MAGSTSRRLFIRDLGLTTAALLSLRQQPAAQRRGGRMFRSDVELVTTPVTVVDGDGRLVKTLERNDFEIFEDGVIQPIAHFTRDRVPASVALVLDASDSMFGPRIIDAQRALERFLDDLLAPEDEAALVVFNHRPRVAALWTGDRLPLHAALDAVHPSGGTSLYDAVAATLPLFRSRRHPRGAMVVVSDGADTASDVSLSDLKATLTGSDVFIYAIAIDSPGRPSTQVNPHALREVTGRGGGYTEVVANTADLVPATSRIADELNHQYMLGFSPERRPDGRYHSIRVRVTDREYDVRSRRGYVAARRGS